MGTFNYLDYNYCISRCNSIGRHTDCGTLNNTCTGVKKNMIKVFYTHLMMDVHSIGIFGNKKPISKYVCHNEIVIDVSVMPKFLFL